MQMGLRPTGVSDDHHHHHHVKFRLAPTNERVLKTQIRGTIPLKLHKILAERAFLLSPIKTTCSCRMFIVTAQMDLIICYLIIGSRGSSGILSALP